MFKTTNNYYKNNKISYSLADEWSPNIDINEYCNRPINYLEIGVYYGNNLISVAKTYAAHRDSLLYCIDDWYVYKDNEDMSGNKYKNCVENPFDIFIKNMVFYNITKNLIIRRGDDYNQITYLDDDLFDIIYINRNCPRSILEDAVLSFRKLKKDGIMIFNNYDYRGPGYIQKGIDEFLNVYYNNIRIILIDTQIFIQKL
jgi:hypothetical protein